MMSLSALVSLLQYPCFALVKGTLGGDPFYVGGCRGEALKKLDRADALHTNCWLSFLCLVFQVNIALTLLTLLAFIHPLCVCLYCRRLVNQREDGRMDGTGTTVAEAKL